MEYDARCTGKTGYVSPGEAHLQLEFRRKTRAKRGKSKSNDHRIPSKPYKCKVCKLWHIGTLFNFKD